MRARVSHLAPVLAITAAGCGACWTREESGPEVSGPVHAEFVVKKQGWIEAGRAEPYTHGIVRVDGTVPREHLADCHGPDRQLAGDADGRRFAYRCADGEAWRVLHLSPKGGLYAMCRTRASIEKPLDWGAVAKLEDAAVELVTCAGKETDALLGELVEQDAALAARVLAATQDEELESDRETGDDAWQRAFAKLPEGEKAALEGGLLKGVADPAAKGPRVWRALVLGGVERVEPAALFDRVEALSSSPKLSFLDDLALAAGLHLMVRTDAKRAGDAACRALEAVQGDSLRGGFAHDHFALVVARSRATCPRLLTELGCGLQFVCGKGEGRHVCKSDELDQQLEADLAKDPLALARKGPETGSAQAALSLAYATDRVPEGFLRRNDRLTYRQDPAEPVCWREGKLGIPCRCVDEGASIEPILCRAQGSDATVEGSFNCVMTFDDDARVIRGKHVCKPTGSCNHDADCCDGTCVDFVCQPGTSASAAPSASSAP